MTMSDPRHQRLPLTGSCHCGAVRYVLFFTVPHQRCETLPPSRNSQRVYRCNCTTCHKMGLMHLRPSSPAHDFLLLSPLDPFEQLGDYTWGEGSLHFMFCKTCGVRPFTFAGDGELVDLDLDEIGVKMPGRQGKVQAWRPRLGGGHPEYGHYLSVNAHTVDAGQGFDMRELSEKKTVMYLDCYNPAELKAPMSYERPQENGCY